MPADIIHIEIEGIDENGLFIKITRECYTNEWYCCGYINIPDDKSHGHLETRHYDSDDPQSYFRAYHSLVEQMAKDSKWMKERYNVGKEERHSTELHLRNVRERSKSSLQYIGNTIELTDDDSGNAINVKGNEVSDHGKSNNTNGGNEG